MLKIVPYYRGGDFDDAQICASIPGSEWKTVVTASFAEYGQGLHFDTMDDT